MRMSQTEYARHRGVKQPYISSLIRKGKIPPEAIKKGKIDPAIADAALDGSLDIYNRKKPKKRMPATAPEGIENKASGPTYQEVRTLHEKIKAERSRIELEEIKKNLLPKSEVLKEWEKHIISVRARLLAIPSSAAPELLGKTDMVEIMEILERYIHDALNEIANGE